MRWIGSIVVALCLIGAGAVRSHRHAAETDSHSRSELSSAAHLVAKLAPRRSAGLPELRVDAFTTPERGGVIADPPPAVSFVSSDRAASPHHAPDRRIRHARGPPS